MQSGVIGSVNGSFEKITSTASTYERNGADYKTCIEVTDTFTLSNGKIGQIGQVARQKPEMIEEAFITDSSIQIGEKESEKTQYTSFISLSGENVIVNSGGGTFAYDIIGRETGTVIERAGLSLDEFHKQHPQADYWQAGFYNKGSDAENGAIYGSSVFDDSDLGSVLQSSELNQIGTQYAYDDNELIKISITESGYIDVHQPDFTGESFLEYFQDDISPIVSL
jgi:hypothetical protein